MIAPWDREASPNVMIASRKALFQEHDKKTREYRGAESELHDRKRSAKDTTFSHLVLPISLRPPTTRVSHCQVNAEHIQRSKAR